MLTLMYHIFFLFTTNTNFVKIYLNDLSIPYGQFSPNQSVGFNVLNLLQENLDKSRPRWVDNLKFKILLNHDLLTIHQHPKR